MKRDNLETETDCTLYVALLEEGTACWRPAPARWLGKDIARLLEFDGYNPEDEIWEFVPGTVVSVERRVFSGGEEGYVAVAAVAENGIDKPNRSD